MKRINKFLIAVSALALIFTSCSGEDGRDGFDGQDGLNGEQTIIYELGGLFFNEDNDYSIEEPIPDDVFTNFTDIVQVYRFLGVDENNAEVWEQIPQTYFVDQGVLQFTFDFSIDRVNLFLTADFNLSTLNDPLFTDDQIFRFAVIPANVSSSAKSLSSSSSYDQVAKNAVVIKL